MHMNANAGFQPKHRYPPRLRSNNFPQLKVSSLSRYDINYDVSLLHHSNLNRITIAKSTAKIREAWLLFSLQQRRSLLLARS